MKRWIMVISCAICLFVIGVLMPYGLNIPTPSSDWIITSNYTCLGCGVNPTSKDITVLLGILIPFVVVIGLLLLYIPKQESEVDLNEY